MHPQLRRAYERELRQASDFAGRAQYDEALHHLERAHILGQLYVLPHTRVHWRMFLIALRRRDLLAAWGQAIRIVLGALGSAVGRVPVGNTGGTNVSMFERMPIDPELARLMEDRTR